MPHDTRRQQPLVVFHSDRWSFPLPARHPFPASKYRLARELIALPPAHASPDRIPIALRPAPRATHRELRLVHADGYVSGFCAGTLSRDAMRRIGFPWSPELVERTLRSCGATVAAARHAVAAGGAAYLAGGTHHAHRDFGAGYCVFNDVAVAARVIQERQPSWRILIVDTDVHQGDGTAAIFDGDPSVITFSIHGERNFPARKHHSDLDVALPDGTGDAPYLSALRRGLDEAFRRARPDMVFWVAGADPWEGDALGRMAVTETGLHRRNAMVLDACGQVPLVAVMGGGYAADERDTARLYAAVVDSVAAHRAACDAAQTPN